MPVRIDFENPEVPIPFSQIKTMIGNYRSTNPNQTKSAWVSADEVLQLLNDNVTTDNQPANGIRIHFARHGNDGTIYAGQCTVVLVATRDDTTPLNPTTENSYDLLNLSASAGPPNTVITYAGDGDDQIPLCPPRCPNTNLFP